MRSYGVLPSATYMTLFFPKKNLYNMIYNAQCLLAVFKLMLYFLENASSHVLK